jgi:threonyl-tRNA synthetase
MQLFNMIIEVVGSGAKTRNDFGSDHDFELHTIRHSCAHILAQAIHELFPAARFGVGPVIENGFYYDVHLNGAISEDSIPLIEARMREIIEKNISFNLEEWDAAQAKSFFAERGQPFKVELVEDLGFPTVTIFKQDNFVDLCRGPHVAKTGVLKNFQLTSVAAAYWRGDSSKPSMQRIYGTAWCTAEELSIYLKRLNEIKERDHRKIGERLQLFVTMPFAPGSPILLPRGMAIYRAMSDYIRDLFLQNGYQEVRGPIMCHQSLWETSGHWDKYRENLFMIEGERGNQFGLKPMNCPVHMSIFGMTRRSHRELPYRLHDQSPLHRNELSGTLSGLTRLRMFCQDDSHIFLKPDQIESEISLILRLVDHVYTICGLTYTVKLSTRPDNALGTTAEWNLAEEALSKALNNGGTAFTLAPKEGAFYGPKIDFNVQDALGRSWQVATAQLDFQMPKRFDLRYTDEENCLRTPVVIHNAIFGALERFLAILIESYDGNFPPWLSPVQACVIPVTADQGEYAQLILAELKSQSIRCTLDNSSERLRKRVAIAESERIPFIIVVGNRERDAKVVTIRKHGGTDLGTFPHDEALALVVEKCARPNLLIL